MPETNGYFWFILIALVGEFLLARWVAWLNLRASRGAVPGELSGVYEDAEYRRSQAYTRARTRLSMVSSSLGLIGLLGFWLLGGFPWLDSLARGVADSWGWLAGWRPVSTGLVFLGGLALGSSLLSLPFSIYSTFVLEERFGFNRTSVRTFVLDLVKGLLLSVALGGPLVAAVLWLFVAAGELAWVWCWAVVSLFTILVQWIGPRFILPLFHRYEPLPEGELREAVTGLAAAEGYDLSGVHVIDASRRTSKANAFFTGFGRTKQLALFDTLVEKLSVPEIVAVVAHEIGHFRRRHVLQGAVLGVLHSLANLTPHPLKVALDHSHPPLRDRLAALR